MAKSAQQRFTEYLDEARSTRESIKEFQDAAYENYRSHSYAAGFLESKLVDVIMSLPRAQREELRAVFRQQAAVLQKEVDKATA
jgi:hypothetical protein